MAWRFWFSVCFIGIFIWNVYIKPHSQYGQIYLDNLELRPDTMRLLIAASRTRLPRLHMDLAIDSTTGAHLISTTGLRSCSKDHWDGKTHCMEFDNTVRLEIGHKKRSGDKCYTITWTPLRSDFTPQDCVILKGARWFGGAVVQSQIWPLKNTQQSEMKPYVVGEYANFMERYWLSSKGVGIYVPDDVPLHVSWNANGNGGMCLKASYEGPDYHSKERKIPVLRYTICEDFDLVRVHKLMSKAIFPIPNPFPSDVITQQLLKFPIWYTGFNATMTGSDIIQFAKDARKNGFPSGYIDLGSIALASFTNNHASLDETKNLIDTLHKLGMQVSGSISTVVSLNSKGFEDGLEKDILIKSAWGQVPMLVGNSDLEIGNIETRWDIKKSGSENGEVKPEQEFVMSRPQIGAVPDFTNTKAQNWFTHILNQFKADSSFDGLRFEPGVYPPLAAISTHSALDGYNDLRKAFVQTVSQLRGPVVVEEGSRHHEIPVYGSLTQHESSWEGLQSLIPQMLQMNLLSYPFTFPGPIGGTSGSTLPDKELYIRWMELAAYMPAMQFRVAPWLYDGDTVKLSRKYVRIHQQIVVPRFNAGLQEFKAIGTPVIRPLWWYHPHDPDSITIDSEFLLAGEDLQDTEEKRELGEKVKENEAPVKTVRTERNMNTEEGDVRDKGNPAQENTSDNDVVEQEEIRQTGGADTKQGEEFIEKREQSTENHPSDNTEHTAKTKSGDTKNENNNPINPTQKKVSSKTNTMLLVAPILQQGARSRDVFLPHGRWRDVLRSTPGNDVIIAGRTWLRNYTIKLNEVATFELLAGPSY